MSESRQTKYTIIAALAIGVLVVTVASATYNMQSPLQFADGKSQIEKTTGVEAISVSEVTETEFTLSVTGTASKRITPDKVSVTLTVETQEKTAQEAARKNAEMMSNTIDALKKLGIDMKQISTSYYNIYPVYEYIDVIVEPDPYGRYIPSKQVLVGYRATNIITVTTDADENVGKIIDVSVEAGANQVQGISYFVSDEVQHETSNQLIEDAVLNAKIKAEKALAPLNMKITGVKSVSINDIFYPVYRAEAKLDVGSQTPIFPSEQQITMSVSVTFLIGK